jgi:MFS family permease
MRAPSLRRLQLAWATFFFVDGSTMVALSVWAFDEHGTGAVGLLGLARLLPSALALPFGAWAADLFPRRRVVTLTFVAMAATQATIAVALGAEAPALLVYMLVALGSAAGASYRPAHLALVPQVARSSEELVAMNVTAGTLEGLSMFAGPAFAALVLVRGEPWLVLVIAAAAAAGAALAIAGVRASTGAPPRRMQGKVIAAVVEGVAELRRDHDTLTIVGCFIAQVFVRGVLGVLVVAVSFDLIGWGRTGVGWLAASMGVGGIVGAIYAVALTGRRRLGRPFSIALFLWGAPIGVIGLAPHGAVAMAALFTIGFGNAVLDVSGFTLIQRLCADRMLGRVFGVLYTFGITMGAVGSVVSPSFISWLGLRPYLVVVGALLPALALVLSPKMRSIDARSEPRSEALDHLVGTPLLSPLPPTTIEKLAAHARIVDVPSGTTIIRQHEPADRFYVIAEGAVEVFVDGVRKASQGVGTEFGEIALLRDTPRTATVVATMPTRLVTLDGRDFVYAVSTSDDAVSIAWRSIEEMLSSSADE